LSGTDNRERKVVWREPVFNAEWFVEIVEEVNQDLPEPQEIVATCTALPHIIWNDSLGFAQGKTN
jgi:hypothetical protein